MNIRFLPTLFLVGIAFAVICAAYMAPPPIHPVQPFFNDVFPKVTPGAKGAWEVVDYHPDNRIPSPLKMNLIPNSNEVLVISKIGEVWRMDLETKEQEMILDLKDRVAMLGDAGIYGSAIHPRFDEGPEYQYVFLYYRSHPENESWHWEGVNRLSKFFWPDKEGPIDRSTEEILFQQFDRSNWHSGGGLFFGNDTMLYLTVGDEGRDKEEDLELSTQTLSGGMFSGILRIDVDNVETRSHPIRRQPLPLAPIPDEWARTYSQGYSIPADNPWLSRDSAHLEEYYAIGLRSPYTAFYDSQSDEIWVGDVGTSVAEEISIVKKAENHQWPYMEGFQRRDKYDIPDLLIGTEQSPLFAYDRKIGASVILGGIYRGPKFPGLAEKMIFADYVTSKIAVFDRDSADAEILIDGLDQFNLGLPDESGIAGMEILPDGTVLALVISRDFSQPGKMLALRNKEQVNDPPRKLSDLGVFEDMDLRQVNEAFIPYQVNSPLWSDRAKKERYLILPNDGHLDQMEEKIIFDEEAPWQFPAGTVFLKHFELPTTADEDGPTRPLESRFFVIGEDGIPYGLTYKWNASGTEAFLQTGSSSQDFEISENGSPAYRQQWDYPGRSQCMTCHNAQAGYVLGVKTHQLNRDIQHPTNGQIVNQLKFLDDLDAFDRPLSHQDDYHRSYPLTNGSVPLQLRIRSYFDANCAVCHRQNGIGRESDLDLRFEQALEEQRLINYPTKSRNSVHEVNVLPGNHRESELWVRDASLGDDRMPPLASNMVDQMYVDSLAKWIDEFEYDTLMLSQVRLAPNPATENIIIELGPDWLPDYRVQLFNVSGALLYDVSGRSRVMSLPLSEYATGIYFLRLSKGNHERIEKISIL